MDEHQYQPDHTVQLPFTARKGIEQVIIKSLSLSLSLLSILGLNFVISFKDGHVPFLLEILKIRKTNFVKRCNS